MIARVTDGCASGWLWSFSATGACASCGLACPPTDVPLSAIPALSLPPPAPHPTSSTTPTATATAPLNRLITQPLSRGYARGTPTRGWVLQVRGNALVGYSGALKIGVVALD
ncbi:hypothetical protein GCM10009534_65130 [Kribbella sandramycini]